MFSYLVVDPSPTYPQYDYQVHSLLPWQGTAVPGGKIFGEWIYVGRIEKVKIKK